MKKKKNLKFEERIKDVLEVIEPHSGHMPEGFIVTISGTCEPMPDAFNDCRNLCSSVEVI